jgi:hypothetical protein
MYFLAQLNSVLTASDLNGFDFFCCFFLFLECALLYEQLLGNEDKEEKNIESVTKQFQERLAVLLTKYMIGL